MILGIDIGGTNIKSAIIWEKDQSLTFADHQKEPTLAKERQGEGILARILEMIDVYQQRFELAGVAISTAGVVNGDTFEIVYANENIPNYQGINFVTAIKQKFDFPCIVENDVNAATLGEWKYGAGKGSSSILCLTVGTGIGGGLIIDNALYRGADYCAAEVGYMSLRDRTFEQLASTQQLVNTVRCKKNIAKLSGEDIFRLAKTGDQDCRQAIQELVVNLSAGISNCIYLVNPEKVILGGGIMEQSDYMIPLIKKEFDRRFGDRIGKPEILAAHLGNSACLAGAYWLFQSYYGSKHE